MEGYLKIAENLQSDNISGEAFNMSANNKLSVLEITKLVLKMMNSDLEPEILNQVSGEIKHQYLSSEKISNLLGWKPKYSIEEGLKETIDWYKKNF